MNLNKQYLILNAPGLSGDFYTNVLEWSAQNLIIVGLNNYVYTWSPQKRNTNNIIQDLTSSTNIQAISCNWDGHLLAAADEVGEIKIYDLAKQAIFQQYKAHENKIGAIAWNNNLITTACKDSSIKIRDIRQKADIQTLNFHKDQVCGIKWSCDGNNLASGGNDNKLYVYNLKMNKRTSSLKSHVGAVKALAWSPHNQNILVSGGGNKDQTLKFWNIQTNQLIKSIHTGSQICNMHYSKNFNEIVTTHGFQLNQISLWNANDYSQITTLYGHSERVLYLAASPDQEDIVTGSADETLRFWKIFPSLPKIDINNQQSKLNPLWLNQKWGSSISVTLQYLLFKKALRTQVFTGNQAQQQTKNNKNQEKDQNVPDINNLMTVDVSECLYFYWGFVSFIVSFIKVIIILCILYYKMGNSMFLGLYVLIGSFAANLASTFMTLFMYQKIYQKKDGRVSLSKDVIEGIKSIKYLGWEQIFEKKIMNLRFQEFKFISGSKLFEGVEFNNSMFLRQLLFLGNQIILQELFRGLWGMQ
ncbi:hypothetical protein IMG5_110000 [Ichthyophthirius multifiliis]|uniref:ABC transmembrane type-1 domain-containing protein n=1 Tax=Ichthyophthirius multifiliis TaxID=5932 RepID=G0QTM9_ICHMU|nr:hypothetical protein IMG5_110000 [Ichthyophthirius multifiliis]EGR31429.1 hypothetical protein IMG5_110000 [Ichthyophthirius multifiliis]|eukprot:XP_004034915.1 hypothetical protein IMG5_110000 [Ichthyophthirius multifiliis]